MVVQLEKAGSSLLVLHTPAIPDLVPFVVRISCNGLAKLGTDQGECVHDVSAFLVKSLCFEAVLGCSEDETEVLGIVEVSDHVLKLLEYVLRSVEHYRIDDRRMLEFISSWHFELEVDDSLRDFLHFIPIVLQKLFGNFIMAFFIKLP
jgi:hypothetical protein